MCHLTCFHIFPGIVEPSPSRPPPSLPRYHHVHHFCKEVVLYSSPDVFIKGKGSFLYSAVSSPLDRSERFTLFAFPDRPVHSDTNPASPGSILARQQLRAKTKSLTFPPLSIARYSFIQLGQWRERKCPIFEMVPKGDSNSGSHDRESGILPLSYRAPLYQCNRFCVRNVDIWDILASSCLAWFMTWAFLGLPFIHRSIVISTTCNLFCSFYILYSAVW